MYVEYPHKSFWKPTTSDSGFKKALRGISQSEPRPAVLLYLHMPYCPKQCWFCTCHTVIDTDYNKVKEYMAVFNREIQLYARQFAEWGVKPNIREVHFGGGSPTFLKQPEFDEMIENLKAFVDFSALDEFSLEIDPRRIKPDMLNYYASKGVDRISFGVQDFEPQVQKAVNRVQPAELVGRLLTPEARKLFRSVNFDIICGLPMQTVDTMTRTMNKLVEFSPDRICLNYLDYAPKFHEHQTKMLEFGTLPDASEKKRLFVAALDVLTKAGYIRTGYDHFAKPSDDVAIAKTEKKMVWNSLGTTPGRCVDILGLGVHSYSRIGENYYAQYTYELKDYFAAIEAGRIPVFREHELDHDDVIRRELIQQLRNYFYLGFEDFKRTYGVDVPTYFDEELLSLKDLEADGIVKVGADGLEITEIGQQFSNLVCKRFDRYLKETPPSITTVPNTDRYRPLTPSVHV